MEALREKAVQLVSQHLELHVVSAVNELCETATGAKESQSDIHQLLALCHDSSSLPRATVATEGVWRAVCGCYREGQCHLLSSLQRVKLATVLQTATSLLDCLLLLPNHFLQLVIKQLPRLPLEVVCSLHSANLLSMGAILVSSPAAVQYMVSAIVSVSCAEDEAEGQQRVMQVVVQVLLELLTEKCTVAEEMLKQLPAALFAQPQPVCYSLLRAAIDCPSLTSPSALDLASILLSSCLAHPPSTILEVVAHQSQWQFSHLPESASSLYFDEVAALGPCHFLQVVQKSLSLEQLNWPALLQSIVCFLHYNESAPDHLACVVKEIVSGALEEGDTHMLTCGLLLARQASLEGAHLFTPYHHWFQAMFSDGATSVVGGKKQLLFLLKTLTTLVPYEPTFTLKVHISHPPHLLGTKRLTQINDYVSLASTRLQDLGEKVPTGPSEQTESNADRDVAEAVAYFSQHGRISQPVREASIFRAPYFVGQFLPSLLSPSLVEEGSRNGLIAALFSEKKIPPRMLKNYEKACQELRNKDSVTSHLPLASEGVACVLGELPHAVIEGKSVTRLLSRLSAALHKEASLPSALQLVDGILSAVCKTVALQEDKLDASYRWLTDLLTILSAHSHFHEPLYIRLTELLNTQLLHLTGCQLLGLAMFLCYVLWSSPPPMATVTETQKSLCRGEEYCIGILSGLRHDTPAYMAQSLKFGCMFVQQLMRSDSSEKTVPASLLHKMKYMYRREKFLQAQTTDLFSSTHIQRQEAVEAVEAVMLEHHTLFDQWQSCKVNVGEWLLWELAVNPTEDAMSKQSRHSYLWNVVVSDFMHSCSAEELFIAFFKTLACSNYCYTELLAIMQELSCMLPVQKGSKPSVLLKALQDITTAECREKALDSLTLATSLSPHLLFASCQGELVCVQFVAEFINHTLGSLIEEMMVLPAPITTYLTRGASAMGRETLQHLCDMCPIYLASAMAHWTVLPAGLPYSAELVATASWLHSGIPGLSPPPVSTHQSHSLAVALWHYCVTGNNITIDTILQPLPAQVVVLVTACCVDWLVQHVPLDSQYAPLDSQLGCSVEAALQACLQQEPSSVEAFHRPSLPAEVQLKHSELLASFRSTFTCNLTAFYPVLLLSLLPLYDAAMLQTLMAEPCFLWLCITAHSHCLSLCISLPTLPPLIYQPLSVQFIQDSNTALEKLIELADISQLQQSMLYQEAHRQLQPFIKTKLKSICTATQ